LTIPRFREAALAQAAALRHEPDGVTMATEEIEAAVIANTN
jgi:hypothetical protein